MKGILLLLISAAALAQTPSPLPDNAYIFGVGFNPGASPQIAGTGAYARKLSDIGTYSFSAVDLLPISVKPFTVNTSLSTGAAQKVFNIKNVNLYLLSTVGIQTIGTNTGWAYTGGGLADIPVTSKWGIEPTLRVLKGSATNGAAYQLIFNVNFRYRN